MNPETQKQPDFNFILSQPGPGDVSPKKKRSPLVWAFAGLLVLSFMAVLAIIFIAPSKNVQNSAFPVTDASDTYLEYIKDSQYGAAYELLSSDLKAGVTQEDYLQLSPVVYQNIDMAKCERVTKDTVALTDEASTVDYLCSLKQGDKQAVISLAMVQENENIRIKDVTIAPRT